MEKTLLIYRIILFDRDGVEITRSYVAAMDIIHTKPYINSMFERASNPVANPPEIAVIEKLNENICPQT